MMELISDGAARIFLTPEHPPDNQAIMPTYIRGVACRPASCRRCYARARYGLEGARPVYCVDHKKGPKMCLLVPTEEDSLVPRQGGRIGFRRRARRPTSRGVRCLCLCLRRYPAENVYRRYRLASLAACVHSAPGIASSEGADEKVEIRVSSDVPTVACDAVTVKDEQSEKAVVKRAKKAAGVEEGSPGEDQPRQVSQHAASSSQRRQPQALPETVSAAEHKGRESGITNSVWVSREGGFWVDVHDGRCPPVSPLTSTRDRSRACLPAPSPAT